MRITRALREITATNCTCGGLVSLAYSLFLLKGSAKERCGAEFLAPAKINSDTPAQPLPSRTKEGQVTLVNMFLALGERFGRVQSDSLSRNCYVQNQVRWPSKRGGARSKSRSRWCAVLAEILLLMLNCEKSMIDFSHMI